MFWLKLITIIMVCYVYVFSVSVEAKILYVDVIGSDSNSGDTESPFKTIQKAADVANPGDTIKIRPGVYYERVAITKSGLSGQPITFLGEKNEEGEWLTILDGSEPIKNWVEAPEIGKGVYKTTSISFEPRCMVAVTNGSTKDIPRLGWDAGTTYAWTKYISLPANATVPITYSPTPVLYWDGIEALYYYDSITRTVYLRFRNGDNPNNKTVRAAPINGYGFYLNNKNNIQIKDLKIRAVQRGIFLTGSGTHNNTIDGNELTNGESRLHVTNGASNNHISNNRMFMDGLSEYKPGASSGPSAFTTYETGVKSHIYDVFKHEVGKGTLSNLDDGNIWIDGAGFGNQIYNNKLFETLVNIVVNDTSNTEIYSNEITKASSVGLAVGHGAYNLRAYKNLFHDNNISIRLQELAYTNPRSCYIYNNKFSNPDHIGNHIYFHYPSATGSHEYHPTMIFYHNSFSGGWFALSLTSWINGNGGLQKTQFINNIFSSYAFVTGCGQDSWDAGSLFELFSYNWCGGAFAYSGAPKWADATNIFKRSNYMWDNSSTPNYILPLISEASYAGIDVSQSYNINGRVYDALPGFSKSYYDGGAPDMGIINKIAKPSAPKNLTVMLPGM